MVLQIDRACQIDRSSIEIDCLKLARSAERWGSGGQAQTVAYLAQLLDSDDLIGAAKVRDELLEVRNCHRSAVILASISAAIRWVRAVTDFLLWMLPEIVVAGSAIYAFIRN